MKADSARTNKSFLERRQGLEMNHFPVCVTVYPLPHPLSLSCILYFHTQKHTQRHMYTHVFIHPPSPARPIITRPPESRDIIEGENITLSCKAFGRPEPEIMWLFNGEEVSSLPLSLSHTNAHTDSLSHSTPRCTHLHMLSFNFSLFPSHTHTTL